MSNKNLLELRKAFDAIDINNTGTISFAEFKQAMEQTSVAENDLEKMFAGAEIDNDGTLSYIEFLGATIEFHSKITETTLVEAFHRIDKDKNGFVSPRDIMEIFPTSKQEAEAILKEIGVHDGNVSSEMFLSSFRKENSRLKAEAMDPVKIGTSSGRRIDDM